MIFVETAASLGGVILLALLGYALFETAVGIARVTYGLLAILACRVLSIAVDLFQLGSSSNRLADRLAAAAANARKLGQGAFKTPVSSMLSLCVLMAVTATIITYSQETAPVEKVSTVMTFPADNVELVDIHGRAIIVTVLSVAADHQSVVIRTKDGREMPILMSRLNPATVEKLTGKKLVVNRIAGNNARTREPEMTLAEVNARFATIRATIAQAKEVACNSEIGREFEKMDAKRAAKILANPEGAEIEFVEAKKLLWSVDCNITSNGIPGRAWVANDRFAQYFVHYSDMAKEMKLDEIPLNEKVSLRPEFEKFGIKGMSQSFEELGCQYQSGYKVMNFWLAKKGMPKVTLDQFWQIGQATKVSPEYTFTVANMNKTMNGNRAKGIMLVNFGTMLGAHIGDQPKRLSLTTGNNAFSYELAKHMLRKGCPLIAEVPSQTTFRHMVVITGFETTNGVTKFEVLDRGYYWEPTLRLLGDSWVFWYE